MNSGPEINFLMLNSPECEIQLLIKTTMLKNKEFSCYKLSDIVFIMLINVKMQQFLAF